jgi:hypothetical protein
MSKRNLFLAFAMLTLSFSALAAKPSLWDAPFCKTAAVHCGPDRVLLFDQVGRCGCLKTGDYLDPNTCRKAYIICDELGGETFASLKNDGEFVGCGCYKTNGH